MSLLRIFVRFAIFLAGIAVLILLLGFLFDGRWLHQQIWSIYAFNAILGVVYFLVSYFFYKKGDEAFVLGSMLAMTIRLLGSGAFAGILLFKKPGNEAWLVADFLLLYLFFTVFEITAIISNLRAQKNK